MARKAAVPTVPMTPADLAIAASRGRWILAPHLSLLNRKLLSVAARETEGLVVEMPPRHGKSSMMSMYFPAWYLGMFPDHKVIFLTYEENFAKTWGRKVQDIIREFGRGWFGLEINPAATAAGEWEILGRQGGMYSIGLGGGVTGRGADLAIIDDPVKNAAEATSESWRRSAADAIEANVMTRMEPGGVLLVSHTRWHEQDPAGLILDGELGGQYRWERLRLPALAEADDPLGRRPGEALWPARYPREKLEAIRAAGEKNTLSSAYWFEALYQQRPTPKEGGTFKAEWLANNIVNRGASAGASRVRFWDLAASEKKGDYTVGVLMAAEAAGGPFVVEDVRRDRLGVDAVDRLVKETARLDRDRFGAVMIRGEQEGGASGKKAVASFVKMLAGFDVSCEVNSGSKEARAYPLASQAGIGNVKLVRADWNMPFINELCRFPRGKHDDQVDAASGALNILALGYAAHWAPSPLAGYRGRRA